MRCLYCGKEVALFKRLRGGEFCSDAHRQKYQEEYTELALHRLALANASKQGQSQPEHKGSEDKGIIEAKSPAPGLPERAVPEPAVPQRLAPVSASAPSSPVLPPDHP